MSALQLINPSQRATMSSREISEITGKEISHIHRDIRTMLDELKDDPELDHVSEDKDARGYTTCFHLPKSLTMTLVAGYSTKLRKAIIDRWQTLEAQANGGAFQIPQTFAQALALAAQQAQAIEVLAIERDQAVATKHLIGSKREATAMATASAAKRESERLKEKLGFNSRHATVIAVENAQDCKFGAQDWRKLKTWCKTNGVEPVPVHDPRWGEAKAWPSGAWMAVFGVDLASLFGQELEAA